MTEINTFRKDFLARELEIGDVIATTEAGYSDQTLFTVVGFTPKKIRLGKLKKDQGMPGAYINEFVAKGYCTLKESYQLCLVQKFDNAPVPALNISF
jgi:hypothetical protein